MAFILYHFYKTGAIPAPESLIKGKRKKKGATVPCNPSYISSCLEPAQTGNNHNHKNKGTTTRLQIMHSSETHYIIIN
jgi:hypothetical protein